MDRTTGFTATSGSAPAHTGTQVCDNCGQPGALNADRHCPRCADLAREADAYGISVALDMLRTTVLGARAYASRRAIEQLVTDALDEYDN